VSEIDQQFIEYVVKSLVGKPEAVQIERRIDEKGVLLELTVDPEDLGRVIGKRGATAQSLRTLLRALGTKNDARYNLKIIDNGAPPPKSDDSHPQSDDKPSDKKADKPVKDEAPAPETHEEQPAKAPEPKPEEPAAADDDETSSRLAQAREELADLDDLDI
jgi:predicted RNA-binding protein YlqC (UPF0109 family)